MNEPTTGPWRMSATASDAVVCDTPGAHSTSPDTAAYYGGHLIAESIEPRNRPLIAASQDLLVALRTAEWALRSFQYGNASEEFAKAQADACGIAIAKAVTS